jgi:hypothetical protein
VSKISLYHNYFARQNRNPSVENKLPDPPKYLIIAEIQGKTPEVQNSAAKVAAFSLLKRFGDPKDSPFI